MKTISLIIPFHDEENEIKIMLDGLVDWSKLPDEIIVINTSKSNRDEFLQKYIDFFMERNISMIILNAPEKFPGEARNIGIRKSSCEYLAFLDSKTLPNNNWLEKSLKESSHKNVEALLGRTVYEATSVFEKNIKLSTFGVNPLTTLPGSLIKKELFSRVGQFVEHVRAGEDGDWIGRLKLQKINYSNSPEILMYQGLKKMDFLSLVKKWFRNYLASTQLPHLKAHKDIYFYFIGFALLLLAFNWNNLSYDPNISGWNTESIFYIPDITKTIFALLIIIYFFVRAIFLPMKKGATLFDLLPLNFLIVFIISLVLDTTKIAAFLIGRMKNILNKMNEFLSVKDNVK